MQEFLLFPGVYSLLILEKSHPDKKNRSGAIHTAPLPLRTQYFRYRFMLSTPSGLQEGMLHYLNTFFLIFFAIRAIRFFIVSVSSSTALAR